MLIKIVELITIFFGIFCVSLSVILGWRFRKVKTSLAKALSHQLIAEGLIGLVTVLFAASSWLDLYRYMTPSVLVGARIMIFTIGAITSVNLWKKVKRLEGSLK